MATKEKDARPKEQVTEPQHVIPPIELPKTQPLSSSPKKIVVVSKLRSVTPSTTITETQDIQFGGNDGEGPKPVSEYYKDFFPFLGPLFYPKVVNLVAFPYPFNGHNLTNDHSLLVESRCNLEDAFRQQFIADELKERKDIKNLNPLHHTKVQFKKFVKLHTSYLKVLVASTGLENTAMFTWSPLIVGVKGEECLVRYNLANYILRQANSELKELLPPDNLWSYLAKVKKNLVVENSNLTPIWDQWSVNKDHMAKIKTMYSNALFQLGQIKNVLLSGDSLTKEAQSIQNNHISIKLVNTNPYGFFMKINNQTILTPLTNTNLSNLAVADILVPEIMEWIYAYVALVLQIVIYYQAIVNILSNDKHPSDYHKFLFSTANLIISNIKKIKTILRTIGKKFDDSSLDEEFKKASLSFMDIDNHLATMVSLENTVTNRLLVHAIQYYWAVPNERFAVKLSLKLGLKVKSEVAPFPKAAKIFEMTDAQKEEKSDDKDDEEDDVKSTKKPGLLEKIANVLESRPPKTENEPLQRSDDAICTAINNQICKQLVQKIKFEEKYTWQTGVTLKSELNPDPLDFLLGIKPHKNCLGIGMDIIEPISKPSIVGMSQKDFFNSIIQIKASLENEKLAMIKANPNDWAWWQDMHALIPIIQPLLSVAEESPRASTMIASIFEFYQGFSQKYNT